MIDVKEACEEASVADLYKDSEVAGTYVEKRFALSWSRLLHQVQVSAINAVIRDHQPETVLEVAPGPARLTTEILGVRRGILVEYSQEMLVEARKRLEQVPHGSQWDIRHGNAFDLAHQELQCDFLYTFRFVRHFHTEDRGRIYENFRNCIKPGGLLMFDVVNRNIREQLDAKAPVRPSGELDVYNVTYDSQEFIQEMSSNGFEVVSLSPVLRHFFLQSWVSYSLDKRIGPMADILVRGLESFPSSHPLEWIALCRRM